MTFALLAFAAGALVLQQQGELPSLVLSWLLLPLGLLASRFKFLIPVFSLLSGFVWAGFCAQMRMNDWLEPALEGRDIAVVGVVSSLPARLERGVRFEFDVETALAGERLPKKVLLSWYRSPLAEDQPALLTGAVHPGERWLLTLRLRRPHGNLNPGGFDYEAWLLERGIGATGYVRQKSEPRLLGERASLQDRIERAREAVRERFHAVLGATPAAGVLSALAVGDQRAIAAEEWRLFSRTGVTHLMSISGLHVTLVSGLAAWLLSALWRRIPWLVLRLPARKAAALAAIGGAFGYTMLAGFAVPAQRTFYMVAVVAAALWAGRIVSPGRTLALALAAVIALDPWAPLAPGFWLSFAAVALIFYVASGWTRPEPRLVQWVRVQWAVTAGLAPAVLLFFGQLSVAGPLANAVAIPVVSAVVTPLALAAAVIPWDAILWLAAALVQWLLEFLEWCAGLPGALWQQHAPAPWAVAAAVVGALWVLAPRGVPGRMFGVALFLPAFLLKPPAPLPGEAWITTFDVGQGLAVLVRTASRTLLYDAGPAFGTEADSGGRIVVPALQAAGVAGLDLIVLTHEDNDHVGGALSVMESVEVQALASSLAVSHPLNALATQRRRCHAGEHWTWDGVAFSFLHPPPGHDAVRRNNQSCVLRVATAGGAMLLTGDIERQAEISLLNSSLKSDVLLVPHHGSRTSSTPDFLAAVAPSWAVFPTGYRSRFGHPHPEVLERYRAAGVKIVRTDLDGAVHAVLSETETSVRTERARRPRYWRAMSRG